MHWKEVYFPKGRHRHIMLVAGKGILCNSNNDTDWNYINGMTPEKFQNLTRMLEKFAGLFVRSKMRESCHVSDQFCTAAANYEGTYVRAVCFKCDEPVCSKCSSKRKYLRYGTVRLCNDCQVELDGNDEVVMRRMRKMAGY